mmetsp:Transcript_101009/g.263836  ORF Transcript_101009/g.263836 Transcript_101009/m.263836 type:complete len:457 (-) Transcript_101009:140-1510(-)|eukprot:CAMPEP_0183485448 /NCGR_PEP_ID=MMETSP0370-20130417/179435_1 /TAXON_ID=268820 /ORGANISM="Peridinium aciculiferum, Strain PAER-2" /LENGTH=456 /DNA_ID=CAMNT_0025678753 /DNA_START=81 /DNA_END=1451 /DNA_ORIENTATION=-
MSRATRTMCQTGSESIPSACSRGGGEAQANGGRRRAATAENATAEEQCHPRKIFVGGLAHKTTTQQLRDHFQRYGSVVDAVVLRWPDGRSRGFGYVTFAEANPANAAIRAQPHRVGGREVDVKRAVPGTNKLFVGGLPQHSTAAELRAHFEQFGVVSDAVVMIDPATSRSRGFGFVCFLPGQEGAEAVTVSLANYQNHRLRGKWIEVKSAAPPHKLAQEGKSEEERLLAVSPMPSASPASSLDPSPRSAGGRPVATPHRQASRCAVQVQRPQDSTREPRKVSLSDFAAGAPPPGLADPSAAAADYGMPPGFEVAAHAGEAEGYEYWAAAASAVSSSSSAVIPGMVTPPPLQWGPCSLSLNSALLSQLSCKAPMTLGNMQLGSGLWGEGDAPLQVQPSLAWGCDPWGQCGLGVAAPLLGREFGSGAFGASLQKSLEELLRLQATGPVTLSAAAKFEH